MQRNYLRGLLICLIPCVLAGAVAGIAAQRDRFRLGIDLAGGTILVYEINLERTAQRKKALGEDTQIGTTQDTGEKKGLSSAEMRQLAEQIKKRIDPTDIKNVTVRPMGDRRLEIILPTGGGSRGRENMTKDEIEETKRLISQMGVLEFRILANGTDDSEGIRATEDAVRRMTPDQLKNAARNGEPPDAPKNDFSVKIGDTEARCRYLWAELSPEERDTLQLSNKYAGQSALWLTLAGKRDQVVLRSAGGGTVLDSTLADRVLFSRECTSRDQIAQEVRIARAAVQAGKLPKELVEGNDDFEIHKRILADPKAVEEVNPKRVEYFLLTRVSPLDAVRVGGDVTLSARIGTEAKTGNICIDFTLGGTGPSQFGKLTRRNKKAPNNNTDRQLAILLDDRVVSSATIQSEITNQGQITGRFERRYVERIVQILTSGALSAELKEKPVSENTIGATLGADTIRKGTSAIGLSFLAVLAFMVFYYRFAGMVACIALFANLLLTIGFMVGVNAAFTLPGLAGLVLTLGMAVDANVLIYERLREERDKGANLATAIRNGYDRAFLTIIDTHLTSIFTAIVLYAFGNDQLKGFAISLTVGLVISLFTSLYMTRLMFDFWLHKKWLTELKMLRLFGKLNLHPMKYRFIFFPLTAVLTIAGLAVFLARGENALNVDFRGGTVFGGALREGEERALTTSKDGKLGFRELLSEGRQKEWLNVKEVRWENRPAADSTIAPGSYDYTITYLEPDGKESKATITLREKPAGSNDAERDDDVKKRAGHLPDISVEQTFRGEEPDFKEGKSRHFTIRTTERQPELVRVSLDRLLRDDQNKTLMAGATLDKIDIAGPKATLTFSQPTSEAYIAQLLERAYTTNTRRAAGRDAFLVTPLDESTDRRHKQYSVSVAENANFGKLKQNLVLATFSAFLAENPLFPKIPLTLLATADQTQEAQANQFRKILDDTKQAYDSTPEPERLEVFDSQLAKETQEKALGAILVSWIAILLYLWFRFGNWTFGLAAVLCLVHDLCFTIGAIAVCHYLHLVPGMNYLGIEDFKIDLAAVAALLTLVGYSVNEIIVNFARVREVRGKNPRLTPDMINDSVNQTLSRTILTAMTVFLVSIVLYIFGGEGVHLFAFVMMMGVMVATYSSIFVACPLLLFLGEGREHVAVTDTGAESDAEKEEKEEEEALEG